MKPEAKAIIAGVAAAAFIIAACNLPEDTRPEVVKAAQTHHAFSPQDATLRSVVTEIYSRHVPDELNKGDSSGLYLYVNGSDAYVIANIDGPGDGPRRGGEMPLGMRAESNHAYVARVETISPQVQAMIDHVAQSPRFGGTVIPMNYNRFEVQEDGDVLQIDIEDLGLVYQCLAGSTEILTLSSGGKITMHKGVAYSTVVEEPAPQPAPVPEQAPAPKDDSENQQPAPSKPQRYTDIMFALGS